MSEPIEICPYYIRIDDTCSLIKSEFKCPRYGIEPKIGCFIKSEYEEFNKIKEEIDDGII